MEYCPLVRTMPSRIAAGNKGNLSIHAKIIYFNAFSLSLFYYAQTFFFHEYGRRVGMVPRSSLKEGKYSQMVEKRTKTTQQQKNNRQPQPKRPSLHHPVVFPLC